MLFPREPRLAAGPRHHGRHPGQGSQKKHRRNRGRACQGTIDVASVSIWLRDLGP